MKFIDITGNQYGRWTVLERGETSKNGQSRWLCRCECGTERLIAKTNLLNGKSTGCRSCRMAETYRGGSTQILLDETTAAKNVYRYYKARCNNKDIYFDLTFEQFKYLAEKPCAYCGEVGSNLSKRNHKQAKDWSYNGLDRVDSQYGYYLQNVFTCCKYCNRMKSDQTLQEFFDRCIKIANNLEGKWMVGSGSGQYWMREGFKELTQE